MHLRRISTDDQLPVPLADLRLDIRIDDDFADATLERMERTAIGLIERRSGLVIMPGTFEALFSACDRLKVQRSPLRQVIGIAALTDRDTWTEQNLADFRVLLGDGSFEVSPYPGYSAPTLFCAEQSVRVQFTAGFHPNLTSGESDGDPAQSGDEESVELDDLVRGVLIALVGHLYENRELFEADKLTEIESTAGGLLNSIRTFW